MTTQIFPIINLNGTNGAELSEQCKNAWIAVQNAIQALHAMAPHGRDYQCSPAGSYEVARIQYNARMSMLDTVKGEILEVYEEIERQNRERREQTGK
jgi:hypothetical protein